MTLRGLPLVLQAALGVVIRPYYGNPSGGLKNHATVGIVFSKLCDVVQLRGHASVPEAKKLFDDVFFPAEYWYTCSLFWEMEMARTNLASMSVEALLKLRDDVGKVLSQKAVLLEEQLSKLGGEVGSGRRGRGGAMKGRKVPIKYRDKEGNTWAGRGAQPVWLREKLKAGAKLEDFAVQKTVASRKASPRKAKKRRRKK